MTVSIGRLAPLKRDFVVAWGATMVVKHRPFGFCESNPEPTPSRHDCPKLGYSNDHVRVTTRQLNSDAS